MVGETNVNGGAGFNGQKALLKIKAPTGSTIVVSKDSYSKQIKDYIVLDDESSYWYFETNDYGTWTVTATLGTQTANKTALVTSNEQYEVRLVYQGEIFYNSTLGGTYRNVSSCTWGTHVLIDDGQLKFFAYSPTGQRTWGIEETFDLTPYTTLEMKVAYYNGSGGSNNNIIGMRSTMPTSYTANASEWAVYSRCGGTGEYTLDISSLTGPYYFVATAWSWTWYFDYIILKP